MSHEALAYDPQGQRLYATITSVQNGANPLWKRTLAVYDPGTNTWTGNTAPAGVDWNAGSEAEYLGGKIYVWRGGSNGGGVNGSDSYLHVYDITSDTWTTTPSLQSSGVLPGFRSGALDVWGVSLAADVARKQVFVQGGEANKLVYVFDVAAQSWRVAPSAPYDGGWGDGLEYVASSERLYQIDGRNSANTPQGTAVLATIPVTSYCTAKSNSLGCVPILASSGVPSASSTAAFDITASQMLNQRPGLLIYGYSQLILPFQGGFKCMSNPTRRTPLQNSGGSPLPLNDCSGAYVIDFNAWIQGGHDAALVACQEVDVQYWSRDSASPSATGLTSALSFVVAP